MSKEALRAHTEGLLSGMRVKRDGWVSHWRELADYILPRRYRWLAKARESMGSPINGRILDSTGTLAARTLASGMMAGITSPTRPWFKFRIDGFDDDNEVGKWLSECERRMMRVMQESNFYTSMATMYFDLVVFGSACIIIYEDFDNVIHCYTPCLGEFFFELSDKFEINRVGREITLTNLQLVEMFGEENVSEGVRLAMREPKGPAATEDQLVCHLIEPNLDYYDVVARKFPWREVYWEAGTGRKSILRAQGFNDWPCMTPRWDVTSNDPYGRAPGMDALGDIKQLQQETLRKSQAIDKMVNPPIIADIQLKNQPASMMPGGWTYVAGLGTGREGARPLYNVMPPLAEMKQDIQEVQQRIKITFHNDLFTGITDLQTVRTATEIDARREEKLVLLGPVLERIMGEGLSKAIDRVWGIMWRGRLFPPAPDALAGGPAAVDVDYVSMLAMAQRGLATAAIEKLWGFAGNISAVKPEILDGLNADATLEEYAAALGVSPKLLHGEKEIAMMRQVREQQAQAQALAQAAPVAADSAKTLSETDVGGGISALQMAMGTQGVQQ
jgi:hypothetical protein